MGRQQQGRHIGSAQPGKGLLRASLAPGAKRRNAGGRDAASTIRRRRMGVARAVRPKRLSVDVCRESQTGCLCAACLHEKSKSGIGIPKPDAELLEARLKHARALDAED